MGLVGLALGAAAPAAAADLFRDDVATVLRTNTLSAEVFAGYVLTRAKEYVYNVPGSGSKLSELDWRTDGLALGGRLAFQPIDGLTLRARGWTLVDGAGSMTDYDWLAGYRGQGSWTDRSRSPDTRSPRAYEADASLAYTLWSTDELALTAIGGYRYQAQDWRAYGGSYLYSVNGFRDQAGFFTPGQLGIGYRQDWRAPYAGVGIAYNGGDIAGSLEVVGSPVALGDDRDVHALRGLVFKEKFATTGMIGVTGGLEYRFSPVVSVAGRVEYTRFMDATGPTRVVDVVNGGLTNYPGPSAGASYETLLLSLGLKVKV
ncbi:MAG: omptin family outer membrane protease [Methylobacteriaceae bacterium]|nr:omptin family outer membrane protease [Methylobacteriaceae bacterium]